MRRLFLAAAISALVLGAAGCSTDRSGDAPSQARPASGAGGTAPASVPPAGTGPAPAGSAAKPGGAGTAKNAGDAALSGNTPAICTQAARAGGEFASMFAQDRKLLKDAESARDKGLAGKARQKSARDVQNYGFALADMAELAADPVIKQALTDMSRQVDGLHADIRRIDDRTVARLRATLDKACGG